MAYPGEPVPIAGSLLSEEGILTPGLYNSFGAMHGTIMIFLGVVPLAVGGFGAFFLYLAKKGSKYGHSSWRLLYIFLLFLP